MVDIGIDFGTTNCTVARLRPDGQIYPLGPIPSVGAWSNEKIVFGRDAKELIASDDTAIYPIRDLKLLLGSKDILISSRRVDSKKVAAELLKFLKIQLVGDEMVGTAVIGTPIRMSRMHRLALREAAKEAGFEKVRFVYEPTAALVGAWDQQGLSARSVVLVVDWGGGTMDISVIRKEDNSYRELEVDGDISVLGGTKIDEEITRQILLKNPDLEDLINRIDGGFERLKEEVEAEKISILEDLESENAEPRHIAPFWLKRMLFIEPRMVFEVLRSFAKKASSQLMKVLSRASIKPEDITHILFAGGTCKSGEIREAIKELLPHALEIHTASRQLLTGMGCARLLKTDFQVELASDFAVRQSDDTLCVLLRRGQRVELDAYRCADFMVTDVHAQEAILELGVCHFESNTKDIMAADTSSFKSMKQMFVLVGMSELKRGVGIGDIVRLYVGVDRNLSVAAYAKSQRKMAEVQEFISGIPLAIHIGTEDIKKHV